MHHGDFLSLPSIIIANVKWHYISWGATEVNVLIQD